MSEAINKVLSIANAEVGYLEKKTNAYLDDKTKNAGNNNFTKYSRDMLKWIGSPFSQGSAWCQTFVQWCFVKAFGVDNAKQMLGGWTAYTPTGVQYFKNIGRWYTSKPKVGDQIYFKNSTRVCHTGLVYKVDTTYVYTIEGNTSGASGVIANGGGVCKKKYTLNYTKIAGYGRPKYELIPDSQPTPAPSKYMYNGIDLSPVFDPTFYANNYPDLKAALGTNPTTLFNHFINYGMKEARQAIATFNPVAYRNHYPDLQHAFGDNWPSYYIHYCTNGISEGRKGI